MTAAGLDRALAALADPARRRAIELLAAEALPSGELARRTGVGAPAMSRHLGALRRAGLVDEARSEVDSRVRVYALRHEGLRELKAWLDEAERGWTEQLSAFRAHVEGEG